MANILYNKFLEQLMCKAVSMTTNGDTFKVALYTSSLSSTKDDASYSSSPFTANEHTTTGSAYTKGGASLTASAQTVAIDATNDRVVFDAPDTTWSSSTITARYALVYDDTHASKIPVCLIDFGSDKSSSSGNFTIQWNASGILYLSQSA